MPTQARKKGLKPHPAVKIFSLLPSETGNLETNPKKSKKTY